MKRAIIYIFLFLGICFFIGAYSKGLGERLNERIIFGYTDNVVEEIHDKIKNKETLYLNGKILVAYVLSSNEKNIIVNNNKLSFQTFANDIDDHNTYKVSKANEFLNVLNTGNRPVSKIETIDAANKSIRNKNIIMNLLVVIIGIGMYFIYIKGERKKSLLK